MPGRLLCFWRKPDHLSINVIQRMESEAERIEREIEVSHGSAGEFSKSTASQAYILYKRRATYLLVFCLIFTALVVILLPLFWFGPVPVVSVFMKKAKKYRIPVTVVSEILLAAVIIACVIKLRKHRQSVERRHSYLSSCSCDDFGSKYGQHTPSSIRSDSFGKSASSSKLRNSSQSLPNIQAVALRHILEDLPEESVKRIQELAIRFLNSGNGRSSIEPGKFNVSHRVSIGSTSGITYRIATKILLIGDVNVGKTSIFHRILYDQFSSSYLQTIGADVGFSTLNLSVNGENDNVAVGIQIWDVGGQEQLVTATKVYYKDAVIIIPVADISSLSSLRSLQLWLRDIINKIYDPYIVLLLNKADLESREITEDDIDNIEELQGVERYEVSAKTGKNVAKAFTESIAKVIIKEAAKLL